MMNPMGSQIIIALMLAGSIGLAAFGDLYCEHLHSSRGLAVCC